MHHKKSDPDSKKTSSRLGRNEGGYFLTCKTLLLPIATPALTWMQAFVIVMCICIRFASSYARPCVLLGSLAQHAFAVFHGRLISLLLNPKSRHSFILFIYKVCLVTEEEPSRQKLLAVPRT